MPLKQHDRQYDLVIWGATGYTGRRVAAHIAAHFPTNLTWAVAGRNESKLRAVVDHCADLNPDRRQPDIQLHNLTQQDLTTLAQKTHLLLSCAGPYALHGEPPFAACALSGTHYLDLTGEPPFTSAMISAHEPSARSSGALMISQAGLESAAPDLVTWVLAQKARERGPVGDVSVAMDMVAAPSGGTVASAIGLCEVYNLSQIRASAVPFAISPVESTATGPRVSLFSRLTGLKTIPPLGRVTTSIGNTLDAPIVQRTWGLHQSVPALRKHAYGEGFSWREYLAAPSALGGAAVHIGLALGGLLLLFAPVRWLLRRVVAGPGEGPDEESSRGDMVRYRAVGGGGRAYCEAEFRGSLYTLSAILMAQAALTILEDDLDLPGGCYTPACLGQGYVDRVARHGFAIEARFLD